MIETFGKLVDGMNPSWPDGTRMRFLPIKGGSFKSEKTKAIIKKRIAYHIWTKAHERVLQTNLVNIHEGQEIFEGQSLSQLLLKMHSDITPNMPLVRHFKRMWSNGQTTLTRWNVSVHKGLYEEAMGKFKLLQKELVDMYGEKVNYFFHDTAPYASRAKGDNNSTFDDDDDSWVDDDKSVVEKTVIEKGFEKFLDDDQSEASWGTSNTKYTELVQPSTQSTNASSLTQDGQVDEDELNARHAALEFYLVKELQMDQMNRDKVRQHEQPYRIVIRAIKEKAWDIDEILEGISAIYQAQQSRKDSKYNVNDHDKNE